MMKSNGLHLSADSFAKDFGTRMVVAQTEQKAKKKLLFFSLLGANSLNCKQLSLRLYTAELKISATSGLLKLAFRSPRKKREGGVNERKNSSVPRLAARDRVCATHLNGHPRNAPGKT